jgi:hypothetical protein
MHKRLVSTLRPTVAVLALTLCSSIALSESHKIQDYPLRIHILHFHGHEHRTHGLVQSYEGDGRANLFENGEPKGLDFTFTCAEHFMTSSGYETYPAKWKKHGASLVMLVREVGSTSTDTCEIAVDVKDFVYVSHGGVTSTEPIPVFKAWMTKHQYDPEHGLNEPVGAEKPETIPPATDAQPQ